MTEVADTLREFEVRTTVEKAVRELIEDGFLDSLTEDEIRTYTDNAISIILGRVIVTPK